MFRLYSRAIVRQVGTAPASRSVRVARTHFKRYSTEGKKKYDPHEKDAKIDYPFEKDLSLSAKISWGIVTLLSLTGGAYYLYQDELPDEKQQEVEEKAPSPMFGEYPSPAYVYNKIYASAMHKFEHSGDPIAEVLLPDKLPGFEQQMTLVVDLDDFLIHNSWTPRRGYVAMKRPGLDTFLQEIAKYYEVILFADTSSLYSLPIVDKLDSERMYFMYMLYKEACTTGPNNKLVKDLNRLNRPVGRIVVLDKSEDSFMWHPDNGIVLPRFTGQPDDNALMEALPFLTALADLNPEDVRPVIKKFGGSKNVLRNFMITTGKRHKAAEEARKRQEGLKKSMAGAWGR